MVEVLIVCPTHGRAGAVTSFATFGDDLLLCVAESQIEAYRSAYPDGKFDVHPDDVVGLAPKRNWMIAKYGTLFMVDDDAKQMVDLRDGSKVEPDAACDVVRRVADMAEETGAYLFGLNMSGLPQHFFPGRPFRRSGEVTAGAWGLREGHGLPPVPPVSAAMLAEDIWYSGTNAYRHRKVFADDRFNIPMRMGQPGGAAGFRTAGLLEETAAYLTAAFGDAITRNPDAAMYSWRFKVPW